jgi:precorrin-6B methylase 2
MNRFENPERIKELNPAKTLKRIGLKNGDIICDIGAGSGIFYIPAAKLTSNLVYSLEINDEMLKIIDEKARKEGLSTLK